jgi:hypothetical protein
MPIGAAWHLPQLKDPKMTSTKRTLHHLLLVSAATLSLGAFSNAVDARVDVQIGFPVPGIVVDERDPYYYSHSHCAGCWYGQWGGRNGYHRGGGRPWERAHNESDHHGHEHGHEVRHEGHR